MSLTRARSPSCKNGLPDLRLLPRCPRPGRSHRTHPPGRQQARGGSWSRKASAAFHTRYQYRREPAHADPQDDQNPRPLPQRRRSTQTDLARDPTRQNLMEDLLQLDQRNGRAAHPLRRPRPRQHLTTHRYTEKRAGSPGDLVRGELSETHLAKRNGRLPEQPAKLRDRDAFTLVRAQVLLDPLGERQHEVTSQPSAPRGWVRDRPPERARDAVSCEHQRLQPSHADPGDSTHEDEISAADPVVDERRAGGQARGHPAGRRRDPEPRDPPPQSDPFCRADHDARDKTPDERRPHGIDSIHDQVGEIPTDRKADQNRNGHTHSRRATGLQLSRASVISPPFVL